MLTNWSFSSLKYYEECPHRVRLIQIDKIKQNENEYSQRGTNIHTMLEHYIKSESKELPDDLNFNISKLDELRSAYAVQHQQTSDFVVLLEENWAFDERWNKKDWYDNPVCRVKCDYVSYSPTHNSVRIIDFKSGKESPLKHRDQGNLYAFAATKWLALDQDPEIRIEFWYIDHNKITTFDVKKKQMEVITRNFARRSTKMLSDTTLKPKPSKFTCKYCTVAHACEHAWEE